MEFFKLLSIFILALGLKLVSAQQCHLREVDLCIAVGVFHYQSNGIPSDLDKLNEWCQTVQEVKDCFGNFSEKCTSPLQKELIQLISGVDEDARDFCMQGTEMRTDFLAHSECLADSAGSDEFNLQMKDMQVVVENMFNVPFKQRFPLLCCGVNRFNSNLEQIAEQKCGKPAISMLKNMMKMIFTDIFDIVCQQYEHQGKLCTTLMSPSGTPSNPPENQTQLGKLLDTVFGSQLK